MKKENPFQPVGLLLVILGVLFNEVALGYHLSEDRVLQTFHYRLIIWFVEAALIGSGIIILRGNWTTKLFGVKRGVWVFVLSLAVCFMFERNLYALLYPSTKFQLFGEMINHVDTNEKVVALSYDDGPFAEYTPGLLDVLDRYHVKATFFMQGENLEKNMDIARVVIGKGHQVGNHTYTHRAMVYLKPSEAREEIERTTKLLREAGYTGEIMFRPPCGEKFIILPMVLKSMGIKNIMWDVEPKDWSGISSEIVSQSVVDHVRNGSIILMHDSYEKAGPNVARSTDMIIRELKAQGYQFKTVAELLEYDHSRKTKR